MQGAGARWLEAADLKVDRQNDRLRTHRDAVMPNLADFMITMTLRYYYPQASLSARLARACVKGRLVIS